MGLLSIFGGGSSKSVSTTNVDVNTTVSVDPRMYTVVDFEALADPLARLADALSGYGNAVERAAVTAVKGDVLSKLAGASSWQEQIATWATIAGFGLTVWWLYRKGELVL